MLRAILPELCLLYLCDAAGVAPVYTHSPYRPVGAAAHIGPNIPWARQSPSSQWALWGLNAPDPMGYRLPSIPPLQNPVLARESLAGPFPKSPNPGVTELVYYDPRGLPPPGSVPLYQPAFAEPRIIGAPDWSRDALYMEKADPLPLPPSYDDLHEIIPPDAYSVNYPLIGIAPTSESLGHGGHGGHGLHHDEDERYHYPEYGHGYNPGFGWAPETIGDLFGQESSLTSRYPERRPTDNELLNGLERPNYRPGATTRPVPPPGALTRPETSVRPGRPGNSGRPEDYHRPTRPGSGLVGGTGTVTGDRGTVTGGFVVRPSEGGGSETKPSYIRPPTRDPSLAPWPKSSRRYPAEGSSVVDRYAFSGAARVN